MLAFGNRFCWDIFGYNHQAQLNLTYDNKKRKYSGDLRSFDVYIMHLNSQVDVVLYTCASG